MRDKSDDTRPSKIKVSGSVKIDNSDVAENHMALANQAYTARNYSEAYIYYTRVLENKPDDYKAYYRKALCAGYLSSPLAPRTDEVINGIKNALGLLGNDYAKASEIADELTDFALQFFPGDRIVKGPHIFEDKGSCTNYMDSLIGAITMLDRVCALDSLLLEPHKKARLSHLIILCDCAQKQNKARYKDGKSFDKNGVAAQNYATISLSKPTLGFVGQVRSNSVLNYNNLPSNREAVANIQTGIQDRDNAIKAFEGIFQEYKASNAELVSRYNARSIPLMVLAIICCVTVFLAPIGVVLFIVRYNLLKKEEYKQHKAELKQHKKQIQEAKKQLWQKKREMNMYAYKNLKK